MQVLPAIAAANEELDGDASHNVGAAEAVDIF